MGRRRIHALDRKGPWGHWYDIGRWRRRAKAQLRSEPLCRMCTARGVTTIATIADHIEPHRGDWNSFWLGKLQSLCSTCHSQDKQTIQHCGYDPRPTGDDGWPLDPLHPANVGSKANPPVRNNSTGNENSILPLATTGRSARKQQQNPSISRRT